MRRQQATRSSHSFQLVTLPHRAPGRPSQNLVLHARFKCADVKALQVNACAHPRAYTPSSVQLDPTVVPTKAPSSTCQQFRMVACGPLGPATTRVVAAFSTSRCVPTMPSTRGRHTHEYTRLNHARHPQGNCPALCKCIAQTKPDTAAQCPGACEACVNAAKGCFDNPNADLPSECSSYQSDVAACTGR